MWSDAVGFGQIQSLVRFSLWSDSVGFGRILIMGKFGRILIFFIRWDLVVLGRSWPDLVGVAPGRRLNFVRFQTIYTLISVRLWEMSTCKCRVEYKGHNHTVWDASVQQPTSTYFCTASLDKTLRLWNTEYAFPLRIFAGHNDSVDVSNNLVPEGPPPPTHSLPQPFSVGR